MESIKSFIEGKLKLKVNEAKSKVDYPWRRKFLGFTIIKMRGEVMIVVNSKSINRFKDKIRVVTNRNKSIDITARLTRLKQIIVGWTNYFGIAKAKTLATELDKWIRHRIRACIWKSWKTIKNRAKQMTKLGIKLNKSWEYANTRKGYWRISNSPILSTSLTNKYLESIGLVSISSVYLKVHNA